MFFFIAKMEKILVRKVIDLHVKKKRKRSKLQVILMQLVPSPLPTYTKFLLWHTHLKYDVCDGIKICRNNGRDSSHTLFDNSKNFF